MKTKTCKIIIVIVMMCTLSGCWDFKDINQKSVILSVGVDRVGDKIEFSGESASLEEVGQAETQISFAPVYTYYAVGNTFEEANLNSAQQFPFPIFLGATRVVAFGENYAKDGIEPYINRIDNKYDYRKTLLTVISSVPIFELFSTKVETDFAVGFFIEDTINYLTNRGKSVNTSVGEIVSKIAFESIGFVLPRIGLKNDKIFYEGLAVIKDAKLVGTISIKDVDGLTFLTSKSATYRKVLENPFNDNNNYSFALQISRRNITTKYLNEKIIVNVDIEMSSQLEYQYYIKHLDNTILKMLEEKLEEKIKNEIVTMVKRTQEEFKSDIINIASYFKAQNPKTYEEIDWKKEYLNSEFIINIDINLKNQGFRDYNKKDK